MIMSEIQSSCRPPRKASSGEMLNKTSLKQRGWTDAGIKRFLGDPDATRPNPKYRQAAPTLLYRLARVEAAEGTPEYLAWKAKSEQRQDAAYSAVASRRAKLLAVVEQWKPEIPVLPADTLRHRAVENYNQHQQERALNSHRGREQFWSRATPDSDEGFLARITVNYIRHVLTKYDRLLSDLRGKVGVEDAKELVREQVYDAIREAYPDLFDECWNQQQRRDHAAMMRE